MNIQIEWRGFYFDLDITVSGNFSDGGPYEDADQPDVNINSMTVCDEKGVEHSAMWLLDDPDIAGEIYAQIMEDLRDRESDDDGDYA